MSTIPSRRIKNMSNEYGLVTFDFLQKKTPPPPIIFVINLRNSLVIF